MNEESFQNSPEMARIEELLRQERSAATGLELDQLKLRALTQARGATPSHQTKGQLMKSRFALLLMIVLGLMMSSTGATLAISGASGEGNAAGEQYRTPADNPPDDGEVLGDVDDQGGQPDNGDAAEPIADSGSAPESTEQVAVAGDGADSLPFTGFLAIPLLIGGVALVATGAVLRRKA